MPSKSDDACVVLCFFVLVSVGLLASIVAYAVFQFQKTPKCSCWEYRTEYVLPSPRPSREEEDGLLATQIDPDAEKLAALGHEGWELADVVLEHETAYPELEIAVVVTNIRPQRLVMIFKRKACCVRP
jgi:hypothetical protein